MRTEASIASIITDESSSATKISEITGAGYSFGGISDRVSKKGNKSLLVWCSVIYIC